MTASQPHHAFITGGGTGIGAAIAAALSATGMPVTLAGRRINPLRKTAAALAGKTHVVSVDVTDDAAVQAAVAEARAALGPVSHLINNAGVADSAPFAKTDPQFVRRLMAVNVESVFSVTRAVLPDMQAADFGRIVNISSIAGLRGYPYISAYCATKHAVIGLTRALAMELATTGITVNAVCPGYTDTDLVRDGVARLVEKTGRDGDEIIASMIGGNPQGRLLQPEEVADAVLWLCSERSASITGQAIPVAGGEIM